MLGRKNPNQTVPSPEEQSQLREEEQVAADTNRNAQMRAAENDPMADVDPENFLEMLGDPDIESEEYDELVEILKPFLSRTLLTTNYDEDDRQKIELSNIALADRIIVERERGRLCTGPFAEIAQGVHNRPDKNVKDRFSEDEKRAVRTTIEDVRTALQYLGINNVGLTKIADTTVETRVQRVGSETESKSRLQKATKKVFG